MKARMKLRCFFPLFLALFFIAHPAFAVDKPQFHPQQTEAEKALDHILTMDKDDLYLTDFICKDPKRAKNWDKEYDRFFTKGLQDAWSKDCLSIPVDTDGTRYVGGSYITGGNGDRPDHYLFYTLHSNNHEAYIDIVAPEDAQDVRPRDPSPFKMTKEKGDWRLDSVNLGAAKFNVK